MKIKYNKPMWHDQLDLKSMSCEWLRTALGLRDMQIQQSNRRALSDFNNVGSVILGR